MNFLFGIQGRIGRLQWWGAQLGILVLLSIPFFMVGISASNMNEERLREAFAANGMALVVMFLGFFVLSMWVNIAVTVKRYHDRDKSGFWMFIIIIPFIGGLWQLVECGFLGGTPGANSFGQRGGGGNAFGDYIDTADEPSSGSLRRMREEQAPARQTVVSAARSSSAPRPAAKPTGFGRRGLS